MPKYKMSHNSDIKEGEGKMKRISVLAIILILSIFIISAIQVNAWTQKVGALTISPSLDSEPPLIVNAGDIASYNITIERTPKSQSTSGSFYATLIMVDPSGLSATFAPNPVYFSSNDYGAKQSTLVISTEGLLIGTHVDDFTVQVTRNDDPHDFKQVQGALWINSPPVLNEIVYEPAVAVGETISFQASATDAESQYQNLTYFLRGSVPGGANFTSDGEFTWIPSEVNTDGYTFEVVVSDGLAEDSQSITILVPFNVRIGEGVNVVLSEGVGLTFEDVISRGFAVSDSNQDPSNYGYSPLEGIIGPYYQINVSNEIFSGDVEVGIPYSDEGLSKKEENSLRLCTFDPSITLVGDFDGNGIVDVRDQTLLTNAINSGSSGHDFLSQFDINGVDNNGDGVLDQQDLEAFKPHLGESYWVDITTWVDIVNNIIYGAANHFSGFGIHR